MYSIFYIHSKKQTYKKKSFPCYFVYDIISFCLPFLSNCLRIKISNVLILISFIFCTLCNLTWPD
ncbi:Uncharacterized protein APZ42_017829 [Daphnia magna]|uniref:Uncharacterized protein n=1 Tax=Daphnia magna TaxID=35525 RepID=A0A164ZJJ6_9CRUS|nr:Uncharacterized protein APZ42_017829 [Daphnia magna]